MDKQDKGLINPIYSNLKFIQLTGTIRGFGPDGDIKTAGPEFMTVSDWKEIGQCRCTNTKSFSNLK
jgi:hypothetical protein